MLKKSVIAVAGLLVLLAAVYAILNSIYDKNTTPAERILDSIKTSTRNYYGQVQSDSFNYDREQSILKTRVLEYQQLTQWAIRPYIKRTFDGVLAEAEEALARAQDMELSSQEARKEGEARAAAAMQEMLENQRRFNEQP